VSDPKKFSHVENDRPNMVDVGEKKPTERKAVAESIVRLNKEIISKMGATEIQLKKGPVFQTAIIAGIQGAKRTSELIPLCHSLALDNCKIEIERLDEERIRITCEASLTGKTGVEMEALTGASIAALTVYDMCKALSHDISIEQTRLISKTGGKNDFNRE
jgi:cyclic pyranopterin phosphate synthase